MITDTELIRRQTVSQMVNAYDTAAAEIRQAYELLATAQQRVNAAFGDSSAFDTCPDHVWGTGPERAAKVLELMKPRAWSIIAEKMQMRRVLSIKARDDLDRQLADVKTLPELTVDNVLAMFQAMTQNLETYVAEAVREVYEFLRPHHSQHKTNTELDIGRRAILTWMLEHNYGGGFRVNYRREQWTRALDNVFSMLDGKGTIASHCGPLSDAIGALAPGVYTGETVYFKFKCYGNGNLHLEFKRLDLLAKLNALAGGARLRPASNPVEQTAAAA